jgi:hypothetical protein
MTNIQLGSNITLTADKLDITRSVTINGNGHSLSKGLLISANNVVIDNTTIKPSEFTPDWYYGVMVNNVTGVVLKNSTIAGIASQDAVGISDTAGSTTGFKVQNVTFTNLWTAVLSDSATTDFSVTGSTFDGIKHGVYVTAAPAAEQVITGNTFKNLVAANPAGTEDAISLPTDTASTVKDDIKAANTFTGITAPADVRVR